MGALDVLKVAVFCCTSVNVLANSSPPLSKTIDVSFSLVTALIDNPEEKS